MTNAERILRALDAQLNARVELTLYGRAALTLGFSDPPDEYALSHDVDAVLWRGQAEALVGSTNFWQAVADVNTLLAEEELYVSHFFTEDQVALTAEWREHRTVVPGTWLHLDLYRLGDVDLLLSKLMRDDPIDLSDAKFIVSSACLDKAVVEDGIARARIPDSQELREEFERASSRLLECL